MKEKINQAKNHIVENKWIYISGGAGIVIGAAGMYILSQNSGVSPSIKINAWKSTVNVTQSTTLVRRGHPGNVVMNDQTGEQWASHRRAAEAAGISRTTLIRHLQGKIPSINGQTYSDLGEIKDAA